MLRRVAKLSVLLACSGTLACSSLSGCSGSSSNKSKESAHTDLVVENPAASQRASLAGTYLCRISLGDQVVEDQCTLTLVEGKLSFATRESAIRLSGIAVASDYGFQLQGKLEHSESTALVADFFAQGRGHFASTTLVGGEQLLEVALHSRR